MFVPRRSTLRYRLDSGDCLGVAWLALGSVPLVELCARSGPDAIVLDLQHGLWERSALEAALAAVPPDVPVIARVAENGAAAIGQALDAGAECVMVPLVETAAQARRAVAASRYPPHGTRSGGGVRPLAGFPDYVEAAESGIVVAVMIETAKGVENAAAIAAVPGIDLVFIGTGDLALSLGTFPNADPRHEEACAAIKAACRAAWTPCGIFTTSGEGAARRRAEGYLMVVTVNDIDLVATGFGRAAAAFRARGAGSAALPAAGAGADRLAPSAMRP